MKRIRIKPTRGGKMARRLSALALWLVVPVLLSSCSVWTWMWTKESTDAMDPSDLLVEGDNSPESRAVKYDKDQVYPGTDIYYIGTGENKDKIIVIDAGHQLHANNELEPVGPGSVNMKEKVAQGATGVSTGQHEYELNLAVALLLRDELYARGYSVVMIRETDNVDISNKERAEIANKYAAAAYIRIHGNSFDDANVRGALTMCQTSDNPYPDCAAQYRESRLLSEAVLSAFCEATTRNQREIIETDGMTGINWSAVPSTIIEMGFMSNPTEDQHMSSAWFRRQAAEGIADGLDAYFKELQQLSEESETAQ